MGIGDKSPVTAYGLSEQYPTPPCSKKFSYYQESYLEP
jgi:hypothetical protein